MARMLPPSIPPLRNIAVVSAAWLITSCTPATETVQPSPQPQPHGPAEGSRGTADRPNILLIDIDTLRADRVTHVRDGTAVAPVLRTMTKNGAHFEQAFAQSGWTMPSLATILTGRYPVVAPEGGSLQWIEEGSRTLPEIFGMYDYHTAVFWGGTLASDYELPSEGFDEVFRMEDGGEPSFHQPIARWLRNDVQEPFFVLVHNIDLHAPRPKPPSAALHRWHPEQPACDQATHLSALQQQLEPSLGHEGSVQHAIDHYDATLLFYNHAIRSILESLTDKKLGLRTVVVITSNHGEDLYEHGVIDHSMLYDTVLQVPLIIRDPALPQTGLAVDQPVQGIDLAPTLLARAGIPVDQNMDGQSLLPLLGMADGSYETRPHFSITNINNAAIRHDGAKLILTNLAVDTAAQDQGPRLQDDPTTPPHLELYDLAVDPDEQHNLIDEQPERAAALEVELQAWLLQQTQRAEGGTQLEVDAHAREVLQERGYWNLVKPEAPEQR